MARRLLGSAAAVMVAGSFMVTTAVAADGVGTPDGVRSTWAQPGTAALDGLGAYLYIAPESVPGPSQLPAAYEYVLEFFYEGTQAPGGIGLGTHPGPGGAKFAGLATGGSGTVILPYDWSPGRLYFLFVHALGDGEWGGWILDVWAERWTVIGQGSTPVEWGRLSPSSWTMVSWEGDPAPGLCSAFPRTDAYFTPAFGVRNGSFTLGTLAGDSVQPNGCPAETSTVLGWAHYRLGE